MSFINLKAIHLISAKTVSWPIVIVFILPFLGNNLFNKPILLLSLICFFILNLPNIKKWEIQLSKLLPLIMLQAWGVLSFLWSSMPYVTLNLISVQTALFVLSILIAKYAVDKNLTASLKLVGMIIILISFFYCVLFYGSARSGIGLKSFYDNKNIFGFTMSLTSLIIIFSGSLRRVEYIVLLIGIALLFLSQSETSILLFLTIFFSQYLFKLVRFLYRNMTFYQQGFFKLLSNTITPFCVFILAIAVYQRSAIADYLISTIPLDFMTGRGEIWITVLNRVSGDLLAGIGPGVFFSAENASEVNKTFFYSLNPLWVNKLAGADGGYIDIIASLGFIGLALFFLLALQNYRLLFAIRSNKNAPLIYVITSFLILHNISESTAYLSANPPWFLFVFSSIYLVFIASNKSHLNRVDPNTEVVKSQ